VCGAGCWCLNGREGATKTTPEIGRAEKGSACRQAGKARGGCCSGAGKCAMAGGVVVGGGVVFTCGLNIAPRPGDAAPPSFPSSSRRPSVLHLFYAFFAARHELLSPAVPSFHVASGMMSFAAPMSPCVVSPAYFIRRCAKEFLRSPSPFLLPYDVQHNGGSVLQKPCLVARESALRRMRS